MTVSVPAKLAAGVVKELRPIAAEARRPTLAGRANRTDHKGLVVRVPRIVAKHVEGGFRRVLDDRERVVDGGGWIVDRCDRDGHWT